MIRLSVNINEETAKAVREIAQKEDINATQVILKAVSLYYFFRKQRDLGKQIQIKTRRGKTSLVYFL